MLQITEPIIYCSMKDFNVVSKDIRFFLLDIFLKNYKFFLFQLNRLNNGYVYT